MAGPPIGWWKHSFEDKLSIFRELHRDAFISAFSSICIVFRWPWRKPLEMFIFTTDERLTVYQGQSLAESNGKPPPLLPFVLDAMLDSCDFSYAGYPRTAWRWNIITRSFHHHFTFTHIHTQELKICHISHFFVSWVYYGVNSPTAIHYFEGRSYCLKISI